MGPINRYAVLKVRFTFACTVRMALLAIGVPSLLAQNCDNGIVRLPLNVSGQITICPAVSKLAPSLDKQLGDLQRAVGAQQSQLTKLNRLVRSLNSVGSNLVIRQQTELLQNVLVRLGDPETTSPVRLNERASNLSAHFDEVAAQIKGVLRDPKTSADATNELHGSIGDAISRLDFETATEHLEVIVMQLKEINRKVDSLGETSHSTQKTVEEMRQDQLRTQKEQEERAASAAQELLRQKQKQEEMLQESREAQAKQQKEFEQKLKDNELKRLNDPKTFVSLKLSALGSRASSPAWTVHGFLAHHGDPLGDPRLDIVFRTAEGQQAVNLPLTSRLQDIQHPEVKLAEIGTKATVCFSAFDARVSGRRLWKANFEIQSHDMSGMLMQLDFVTSSDISLTPDQGLPCRLDRALATGTGSTIAPLLGSNLRSANQPAAAVPAQSPGEYAATLYRAHRYGEALPLLQQTASAGDAHSAMILGGMYAVGVGVPPDLAQAMYWWRKGADLGDSSCMVDLGASYTSTQRGHVPNYVQAAAWYKKAADAGESSGMTGIGLMYLNGQGGYPRDDARAVAWFEKAASKENAFGMLMLGRMYSAGRGVPRNTEQAVSWYSKAAALGNSDATKALNAMH